MASFNKISSSQFDQQKPVYESRTFDERVGAARARGSQEIPEGDLSSYGWKKDPNLKPEKMSTVVDLNSEEEFPPLTSVLGAVATMLASTEAKRPEDKKKEI